MGVKDMEFDFLSEYYEFSETEQRDDTFALLIYDIVDNKRRQKLSVYMEGYGVRVQKSAFEIRIDKRKFSEMLQGIPQFVTKEDSVKLYKIRGNGEVYCWGNARKEISEEIVII